MRLLNAALLLAFVLVPISTASALSAGDPQNRIRGIDSADPHRVGIQRGVTQESHSGIRSVENKLASGSIRWVSPDPLFLSSPKAAVERPGELNLYSYGSNNPVVNTDPDGLLPHGALGEMAARSQLTPQQVEAYNATDLAAGGYVAAGAAAVGVCMAAPEVLGGVLAGEVAIETAADVAQIPIAAYDAVTNPNPQSIAGLGMTLLDAASGLPTPGAEMNTARIGARSGSSPSASSPSFVVTPKGTAIPVPKGATGPSPVVNPAGRATGLVV